MIVKIHGGAFLIGSGYDTQSVHLMLDCLTFLHYLHNILLDRFSLIISIRIFAGEPTNRSGLSPQELEACNVLSLKALRALLHFKLDCLTFAEGLVTVHHDRREVHENILSSLTLDESEPFRSIKPLHRSLFLHVQASHAQLRPGRSRRYWNCVASLSRFQRPQNLCLQPLERIRGWYKSSKRQVNSTTKSDLCPRPCADPERVELPSKQLKIQWLVGYGR